MYLLWTQVQTSYIVISTNIHNHISTYNIHESMSLRLLLLAAQELRRVVQALVRPCEELRFVVFRQFLPFI